MYTCAVGASRVRDAVARAFRPCILTAYDSRQHAVTTPQRPSGSHRSPVTEDERLLTPLPPHPAERRIVDPHTAVGVKAALECVGNGATPICLATAHPAKFGEAVLKATGIAPPLSGRPGRD